MTFQIVRGAFEKLSSDALVSAGVALADVSFDNFGETKAPSDRPYAVVAVSFADIIEDVIGCSGIERLNGSMQVNINTPKQQGSKPAEDIALSVIKAWDSAIKDAAGSVSMPPTGMADYQNAVLACSRASGEYRDSDVSSAGVSFCNDDTPLAGVVDYDNADVNPRSEILKLSSVMSARCKNINGPQTLAPTQKPHHTVVISCAWTARVA